MSFQGDVAHIPLSNILQALLLNQQEGVLTTEVGSLKRRLRVLKGGLRPLNYDAATQDLLREVLLKQRALTEVQFQNIFSAWEPGSHYPGDFLIKRRILTQEMVTTRIRHQLEDLVLELIVAPDLKYEFTAATDATEYELFSPTGLGEDLLLMGNGLLMEAVRRDDEWRRIREAIPASDEIYIAGEEDLSRIDDLDVAPQTIKELKPLLNGKHTVGRLVSMTALSSFEVHQTLFQLKERNLITPLGLEQKKDLAKKFQHSWRAEAATDIYRSILLVEPHNQDIRLKLLSILEKKSSPSKVVENYLHLASEFAESDSSQCKAYLKKALNIQPRNISALERLFEQYRSEGNDREALAVARSIVQIARSAENPAQAIDLLYKIINFYPEEGPLFHELAEIHLLKRNVDAAVECLTTAAQIYKRRRDTGKLCKTYEQLARLKPSEAAKFKRLAGIQKETQLSALRIAKICAAGAFAGLILTALAFVGVTEYFARSLFAQVLQDINTQKQHARLALAESTLLDFQEAFPFSTRTRSAQALMREITQLADTREEENRADLERRQVSARSTAAWAKIALQESDYLKASDLLEKLDIRALGSAEAQELKALTGQLNRYFAEAKALLSRAQAAESRQDLPSSWAIRKKILRKYPYSRVAKDLLLPVLVETLPPGADVIIKGQIVGQTPKHISLPIHRMPPILLSKKGYKLFNLTEESVDGEPFRPSRSHRVRVQLLKSLDFELHAKGSIEGFPAVRGENVYFGTRNGKVLCVRQDTGKTLWTFEIPRNMDFSGGLGLWKNLLYFGSFDGHIYVLDATSGQMTHDPFPASPKLLPIKYAPSSASEKGLVAVNCNKKIITTYNIVSGAAGWSMRFPKTRVLGQPQASQGKLYFCTEAGEVIEADHETGSVRNRVALGFNPPVQGRLANGKYFIGSTGGKLVCLEPSRSEALWTYDCGEAVTSPPTVAGELVVVPTETGKLHCLSTSGELRWTYETNGSIYQETEGVLFRNNFLIGTAKGQVLCLDIWSGQMLWRYDTRGFSEKPQKGIRSSGTVSRGRFFVGSEDHSFYALPVD